MIGSMVHPAEVKDHVIEELAEIKGEVTILQIQRIIPFWFQSRIFLWLNCCTWGWRQGQASLSLLLFLSIPPPTRVLFVAHPKPSSSHGLIPVAQGCEGPTHWHLALSGPFMVISVELLFHQLEPVA